MIISAYRTENISKDRPHNDAEYAQLSSRPALLGDSAQIVQFWR